jgi:hypothetical protein
VYRGAIAGGESNTAIATGITMPSYTDAGLLAGTPYYYQVAAVNASGRSALSGEASATTQGSSTGGPNVSSLSPAWGPVGTSVTITGASFGATQGTSTVTFNGTTAAPTAWSSTSITVPVPTGATTGSVVVTVGGLASNGYVFIVGTPASVGVNGTGLDSNGNLAAVGSYETRYLLTSSSDAAYGGPNAYVVAPVGNWTNQTSVSQWIAPRSDPANGNASGSYNYRLFVDMTGYIPSTASFSGRIAADDSVALKVNGLPVATGSSASSFQTFSFSNGFIPQFNAIELAVTNAGGAASPTGVRLELTGTAIAGVSLIVLPSGANLSRKPVAPEDAAAAAGLAAEVRRVERRRGRRNLAAFEHLPVTTHVHELSAEERACPVLVVQSVGARMTGTEACCSWSIVLVAWGFRRR